MEKLKGSPALVVVLCLAAVALLVWQIRRATTPPPTLGLKDMPANIRDDTTPPRPGYVPAQPQGMRRQPGGAAGAR